MLAEFLDRVVGLARSSDRVERVESGDPRVLLLRTPGGELVERSIDPPLRDWEVADFDSLIQVIQEQADPVVFVGDDSVEVLLDEDDRRERCSLSLSATSRWNEVLRLECEERRFGPRDAVRWLRFQMHSMGDGLAKLGAALSRIDFERKSSGQHVSEHGRESLGRSVEARVQKPEEVPESVVMRVPIWTTGGLEDVVQAVRLGVFIDSEEEKVGVRVLADETDAALARARRVVAQRILAALGEDANVPVLLGEPTMTDALSGETVR